MTNSFEEFKAQQFVLTKRADLLQKIRLAKRLGFTDDVHYWTSELNQFDNAQEESK